MSSIEILLQITKFSHLRHRFVGVFFADTFPFPSFIIVNTFIIVNSENFEEGMYWLLICNKDGVYLYGDPLGSRLDAYKKVNKCLTYADFSCEDFMQKCFLPPTSIWCGLYYIWIAPYVFSGYYPVIPVIVDESWLRFETFLNFFVSSFT